MRKEAVIILAMGLVATIGLRVALQGGTDRADHRTPRGGDAEAREEGGVFSPYKENGGEIFVVDLKADLPAAKAGAVGETEVEVTLCLPDTLPGGACASRSSLLSSPPEPTDMLTADGQRRPVTASLVHPTDYEAPVRMVRTCEQFAELWAEGWGGLTTADRADEARFLRYCGLRRLAALAQPAERSRFDGTPLGALLEDVPEADWPTLPDERAMRPAITALEGTPPRWSAQSAALDMRITDIGHADFDDDGDGEHLLFLAGRMRGGTLGFSTFALLENTADGGRLRRIDFR
ncbi:hypothetical protein PB2503_01057 [Parvularcula bermudensis HTCC2503]|uniref:Uncharacterized protein n=1 Tax=Parvularcula bermudensis (strain ATCC BAA-594 / HTCC2503 / KCTC 12087) TaxID=314260 RepID=E0TB88_PARBH|nr:hypothetical protein [Parvularcula bermudensis]ADM08292.1 hypothetical protein PB2503_01057 [Parvularcula bermudensis HTCC2503]